MAVEFHPAALDDIFEAGTAYELDKPGLGERFTAAVGRTTENLDAFPRMGRLVDGASPDDGEPRRFALRGFPYLLVYSVVEKADHHVVYVYSVTHERRRGTHWLDRVVDPKVR